jgi:hypothetical protein
MATTILRPTSTVTDNSFEIVGGATVHSVLDDSPADDATYIGLFADDNVVVGLTDITVAAGSVVKQVKVRVRSAMYALNPASILTAQLSIGGETPYGSVTVNWLDATEHTLFIDTTTYTDAEIDAATLELSYGGGSGTIRVTEAYVDVVALAQPVVVVTDPETPITAETTPLVNWAVSFDSDGGVPTHFEAKIFDEATYTGGGFSATTSTAVEESGEVEEAPVLAFGYIGAWYPTVSLEDGMYRAYVRTAQTVNGELFWSDWDYIEYEISVYRPLEPTMTLQPDDANGRILIEFEESSEVRTNLVTNPKLGTNTTNWVNTSLVSMTRVTSLPATGAPDGITTGLNIVGNAASDRAVMSIGALNPLKTYRVSAYVRVNSLSATSFTISALDGITNVGSVATTTVGGNMTRYDFLITPISANAVALLFIQIGAGAMDVTFTAVLAEVEDVGTGGLRPYFDGDSDFSSWTGTADNSTSTQDVTTTMFQVERSIDGGGTWDFVRTDVAAGAGFVVPTAGEGSVYDYEAPNGIATMYRARAVYFITILEVATSMWAEDSTTWSSSEWWVKHPFDSTLNRALDLRSLPSEEYELRATPHYVLGRAHPIVVSDVPQSPEGDLAFFGNTEGDRTALDALLISGAALLIQAPNDMDVRWPDRWVRFTGTHGRERPYDNRGAPLTFEPLHWIEVARPEGAREIGSGDPLMIG